MKPSGEDLFRQAQKFVAASGSGLLQLLVAAARRQTLERIIACPTYPVAVRSRGLAEAVRCFLDAVSRPDVHAPTFLARLYASVTATEHRKQTGQFFTAASTAEWALSLEPPLSTDDVCDAGAGTGVFAEAILRKTELPRSYLGIELDPTLALCCAHTLDALNAPSSFRVWYANYLLLEPISFRERGLRLPSFIISNPPYVRFHKLTGRADILISLKSSLGIELSPLSGSVGYFLSRAASLVQDEILLACEGLPSGRMLFLLPKEAAGAAHARRLRQDLRREHGWAWREYPIPGDESAIEKRSNALALVYAFERRESAAISTDVRTKASFHVGDLLRVRRGISTGCNDFFVLTDEEVRRRKIPPERLERVLPTRVPIKGEIFSIADWDLLRRSGHRCWLLALPNADIENFEPPIRDYLKEGIRRGVHQTPTGKKRKMWFSLPIPALRPEAFVTYLFRGAPHFSINEAGVVHLTNILGCRFNPPIADPRRRKEILAVLNGQARLWIERDLAGREYKGGLRKIEPGELTLLPVDLSVFGPAGAGILASESRDPTLFG